MNILIDLKKVVKVLLMLFMLLLLFHFFVYAVKKITGHNHMYGFYPMFNFNLESNIPTLFSTLLLFISTFLFYFTYLINNKKKDRLYWIVLTLIFLYLSVDESCQIHEMIRALIGDKKKWMYLAFFICSAAGVAFFRFWMRLDRRVRYVFLVSAVLYISGILILDEVAQMYYESDSKSDWIFYLLITAEESSEMLGLILLIYGQMRNLALDGSSFRFTFLTNSKSGQS